MKLQKIFLSYCNRYQNNLEELKRGNKFVSCYVDLLYYKCHKINLNHSGSYTDSRDWIKNIKTTINPINKNHKCFQCAVTVALNHEEIKKDKQRLKKINLL